MDASGYQEFDLDDVEFYREIDQLDDDAVFKPCIDTRFSPSTLNGFQMGTLVETRF